MLNIFAIIFIDIYATNANIKYIIVSFKFIIDNEKSFSNPNTAIRNEIIIEINNVVLIIFNGFDILYICMNPIVPNSSTASVDISCCDSLKWFEVINNNIVENNIVIDVGNATDATFIKNLPFTFSLFGSSARINAGIPIVNTLVNVNCIGINGYVFFININSINKSIAYNVFVIKRDADLSRLFIILLPSANYDVW